MKNTTNQLLTAGPTDGPTVSVAGNAYRMVVTGNQTGGDYALIEMLLPPGGGPGPHEHPSFHETYYVLDGEVQFWFDDQTLTARPGQLVSIPKGGGVHQFKNKSAANARMLCTVVPAGLDEFFLKIGQPVEPGTLPSTTSPGPDELERIKTIGERYGQTFFPPDYFDK